MRAPLNAQFPNVDCVECRTIIVTIVLRTYKWDLSMVLRAPIAIHIGREETVTDKR